MHDSRCHDSRSAPMYLESLQAKEGTLWELLRFTRALRVRFMIPVIFTAVFFLIGLAYYAIAPRIFVAKAEILYGAPPGREAQLLFGEDLLSEVADSLSSETTEELKTIPKSIWISHFRKNLSLRTPGGRPFVLELRYQSQDIGSGNSILGELVPRYVEAINRELEENEQNKKLTRLAPHNSFRNQNISSNDNSENHTSRIANQKNILNTQNKTFPETKQPYDLLRENDQKTELNDGHEAPLPKTNGQVAANRNQSQDVSHETKTNTIINVTPKVFEEETAEIWLSAFRNIAASLESLRPSKSQKKTQILLRPTLPAEQVSPRSLSTILFLAVFLGIGSGLGAVYILDAFDTRFRSPSEMSRQLSLPILGVITKRIKEEDSDDTHEQNDELEQFQSLRVALELSGNHLNKLVVSSADPGDGKTTISAQLAKAFSQSGQHTLLIDANLRNPDLSHTFSKSQSPGLTQIIANEKAISDAADEIIVNMDCNRLDFLPSGNLTQNPISILTSHRFAELIQWCETKYDRIIVDAPNSLHSADAAILGNTIGNTLVVIRPEESERSQTVRACQNLWSLGSHLIGVVANQVESNSQWLSNAGFGYVADGVPIHIASSSNRLAHPPQPEKNNRVPDSVELPIKQSNTYTDESRVA